MTSIRASLLTGVLAGTLLAFGCGKTTRLGQVRPDVDGGGATAGEGGTTASGGASGGGGSGTTALDAGPQCYLPEPPPISNPTPQDMERENLIHDYCITLEREGCFERLTGIVGQTRGCSLEGRIRGCELHFLHEYARQTSAACADEWHALMKCVADEALVTPCFNSGPLGVCEREHGTLTDCTLSNPPWHTVAGSRGTCTYGDRSRQCNIFCNVGPNSFWADCDGPPGSLLQCSCRVNHHRVGTFGTHDLSAPYFYATDCDDAASLVANGAWCTNQLDCCLEWDASGERRCGCGPAEHCEVLPQLEAAQIVESCPTYQPNW
jgi:hypothetical protein